MTTPKKKPSPRRANKAARKSATKRPGHDGPKVVLASEPAKTGAGAGTEGAGTEGARERILAAAQRVYASEGYAGFSMRKVAKEAGLSTMASYRHFPDKDHILHELVVHGFALFGQSQQRLLELSDPYERVRAGCDNYRRFAEDNPSYFELMFMATDDVKTLKMLTPEGAQTMAATFFFSRRAARDCGAPREIATQESVSMWAQMHGLIALHAAGRLGWIDDYDAYFATEMDRMVADFRRRMEAAGHQPSPTGPGRGGSV